MKPKITRDTLVTNFFVKKLHVWNFYSQNRIFALLFVDRKIYNNIVAVYQLLQKINDLTKQIFVTKIVLLFQEADIGP